MCKETEEPLKKVIKDAAGAMRKLHRLRKQRIDQLEAALREISSMRTANWFIAQDIANKALTQEA